MSQRRHSLGGHRSYAPVFAALGDETRLSIVARLSGGQPHSITQLTGGSRLSRQAITKHLQVLERAGLVQVVRHGREARYALTPEPLGELEQYLADIGAQWDQALSRLKSFVEG